MEDDSSELEEPVEQPMQVISSKFNPEKCARNTHGQFLARRPSPVDLSAKTKHGTDNLDSDNTAKLYSVLNRRE